MSSGFEQLSERSIHQWHVWDLIEGQYRSPSGEEFVRTFVRSPGAVSVIAVDETVTPPTVILIRQWRAAMNAEVWEVPAGMRDKDDEDPAETGRRELVEEVGFTAGSMELLTVFHPSVGITDGSHHVYLARGLTFVGAQTEGPEEEHLMIEHVPFDQALRMMWHGTITASSAVIGLLMAAARLGIPTIPTA